MTSNPKPLPYRAFYLPAAIGIISLSMLAGYMSSRRAAAQSDQRVKSQVMVFNPGKAAQPVSYLLPARGTRSTAINPTDDYRVGMQLLERNYFGAPITASKQRSLTYSAIRGMLLNLHDPFTSFMTPTEWNQFQATTTRGDFEGIGIMLMSNGPNTVVEEPIKTGPAEKAGVKAGDIITEVNRVPVTGKSLDDVVKLIKGPAGTSVHLTVVRGKKTLHFVLVRALVRPPIVQYWMEDPKYKIGHIVLEEFNEQTMTQMNQAFLALRKQGMRALVLDLRYNPGGLLTMAIRLASAFVPRNYVPALHNNAVIIHDGSGEEEGEQLLGNQTSYKRVPLAVLVNGSTASASEIVSGAIHDYGVGTLIGERTFGKGCVQTLYPLDDGSCLRLTTALYYPPKHYDINYKQDENHNRIPGTGGLVPAIIVKQSPKWIPDDFEDKKDDTQLKAALAFLRDRLQGQTVAAAVAAVSHAFSSPKEIALAGAKSK